MFKPLAKDEQQEYATAVGLQELRNRVAFCLILINGLLIMVVYLLQVNSDVLSFTLIGILLLII